jgi:hypothetical protein
MKKNVFILFFLSIIFTVYSANVFFLDFKHKNLSIETTDTSDGKTAKTIKDFGQSEMNLQIKELTENYLIDKQQVVVPDRDKSTNIIVELSINSMVYFNGDVIKCSYSIFVEIYNEKDQLMSKKLFKGQCSHSDFTDKLSSEIATYILGTAK